MTSSSDPFDDTTKAFYRRFFEQRGMVVETEREVFFRGRAIDIVVNCTNNDRTQLQNTVFSHFQQTNALELKGINDPLTLKDYNRIMMRVWGIGGLDSEKEAEDEDETQQNDSESDADTETESDDADDNQPVRLPNQRTVTIICVRRPNKILNQLKEEMRFFQTEEPGIYHCQERLSQWIIHPSELTLTPKNYPLLPLARGNKLEQFISLCLKEDLTDYLQLIGDIGIITDPNVIWRKILELKLMKPKIREDTWPYIDRFFREMPEEMWKIPTFQEALAKSQRNGEQQGALMLQKTLIRQLRRKFTPLPDSVVQKIESTTDLDQLDNWLDQILVAESLADMGLIGTEKPKM